MNDFWASTNRELFFESLSAQRRVAEQRSMGDSGKFLRPDQVDELGPKFGPNARVLVDDASPIPNGFRRCFAYSDPIGPGAYRRIEVIVPHEDVRVPAPMLAGPRISI